MAVCGTAFGVERLSIVIQKTRQLTMQKTAIRLTNRSAVRLLRLAARFENLMKDFDLPSQSVPFELLDRVLTRMDREIGEKLPLNFPSPLRRSPLLSMDHGQSARGICLLFANRREDSKLAKTNFEKRFIRIAVVVLDLYSMQAVDRDFVHGVGNCMTAFPGKPVNAGSNQEMRSNLLGQAEQLVNVALAIANMNTSFGYSEKVRRLPQILQPADALLLLDRNPRRVDLSLQRCRPFERFTCPELDCRQTERKPIDRHGQARMH